MIIWSHFIHLHAPVNSLLTWNFAFSKYTLAKLFELSEASLKDPALLPDAQRLQGIVARADFTIAKASSPRLV